MILVTGFNNVLSLPGIFVAIVILANWFLQYIYVHTYIHTMMKTYIKGVPMYIFTHAHTLSAQVSILYTHPIFLTPNNNEST